MRFRHDGNGTPGDLRRASAARLAFARQVERPHLAARVVNVDRPLEELIDAFEERAGRKLLTPEDAPLESRS